MSIPAIIYLVLTFLGLMVASYQHGKKKEGNYNVIYAITSTAITLGLLFWGGFFN